MLPLQAGLHACQLQGAASALTVCRGMPLHAAVWCLHVAAAVLLCSSAAGLLAAPICMLACACSAPARCMGACVLVCCALPRASLVTDASWVVVVVKPARAEAGPTLIRYGGVCGCARWSGAWLGGRRAVLRPV
jgi:hypothetical protein